MKRILALLTGLLLTVTLAAQVHFTAESPTVVEVGEQFRLVFTCDAEVEEFTPPVVGEGLRILAGPTSSTMYRTNFINGKRTESRSVSYTYILEAVKEGKYVVGAASVKSGRKSYGSNPITIEVVGGGKRVGSGGGTGSGNGTVSGNSESGRQDVFMRLYVSKNRVVKGEHLVATLKLYTRVDIASFEDVKFPTFNGFWSQETYTPTNLEFQRENYNGQVYSVAVLRRYILLPQQTGNVSIAPAELTCMVRVRRAGGRSFMDDFFDNYQTSAHRVVTPPVNIRVDALPAGAPASFNGAVGKFSIAAKMSKDSVNAHDAVSLLVTLSGEGNINLVEAPKVAFPPDFETYDCKVTDNSRSAGGAYSGTKQYEYPVIPRSHGDFTIDPLVFTYYDIQSKSYKTIQTKPLRLKVGKVGQGGPAYVQGPSVNRRAVQSIGEDIRYIFNHPGALRAKNGFLFGTVLFWALAAMVVALFFVGYFWLRHRRRLRGDVVRVRNRKANKTARMRLRTAETLLHKQLYSGYYEELHRALWGYMSDKLGLAQADCTRDHVAGILEESKVPLETIRDFLGLIEACEFARYSPDPGQEEKEKIYTRAVACISKMEQNLK